MKVARRVVVFWAFLLALLTVWARVGMTQAFIPITDMHVKPGWVTGNPDDVTGAFSTFSFIDQTLAISSETSIGDLGPGSTYVDYGHAVVNQLRDANNNVVTDDAGIGEDWIVWVDWEINAEIVGVRGTIYDLHYTSGWVNAYLANPDWDFGTTQRPQDDTWPSEYRLILRMEVDPVSSTGYIIYDPNTDQVFRNASVNFTVQWIDDSVLYSDSYDLSEMASLGGDQTLFALTTESAASGLSDFEICEGHVCAAASGTGSMEFATVPEPSSVLLLGMGVFGFAAVARRSFFRSS